MSTTSYAICLKKENVNNYLGWDGEGFTFMDDAKMYETKEEAEYVISTIDKNKYKYDIVLIMVETC